MKEDKKSSIILTLHGQITQIISTIIRLQIAMEITTIDSSQKEDMANNQRDILLWGSFFKENLFVKDL